MHALLSKVRYCYAGSSRPDHRKFPEMSPKRTIILGGARSGKSSFAERLAVHYGKSRVYIATAQALDDEMRSRIERHISRRGAGWRTVEAPLDVASTVAKAAAGEVLLLDCATLWLSNHLLAGTDLSAATNGLLSALRACPADVIVVSNEVGFGIVPDTPLGRQFRDAQGRLNQHLAEWADLAVLVVAGIPLVLKGTLPRDMS